MADSKRESREVGFKITDGCGNEACYCDGSCREDKARDLTIKVTADVNDAITGFKALSRELREATKAARELEQAYKDVEKAFNSDKIASINDLRDIQGTEGNYDVSDYMCGMYNGLELASATLEGRDPEYKPCKPAEVVLSEVPTEVLREELSKRTGVEEYVVKHSPGFANLEVGNDVNDWNSITDEEHIE